jgi:hypothetical protein
VPADECVRVGSLELEVPETLGVLSFDLTLTAGAIGATNHYASAITVVPD